MFDLGLTMVNAQLIVYILISITVPCVSGVVMWVPTNYPNPLLTPAACGMPGRSWICDPSGILNVTQGLLLLIGAFIK